MPRLLRDLDVYPKQKTSRLLTLTIHPLRIYIQRETKMDKRTGESPMDFEWQTRAPGDVTSPFYQLGAQHDKKRSYPGLNDDNCNYKPLTLLQEHTAHSNRPRSKRYPRSANQTLNPSSFHSPDNNPHHYHPRLNSANLLSRHHGNLMWIFHLALRICRHRNMQTTRTRPSSNTSQGRELRHYSTFMAGIRRAQGEAKSLG